MLSHIVSQNWTDFDECYKAIQDSQAAEGFVSSKAHVNRRHGYVARCEVRCQSSGEYRQWQKSRRAKSTTTRKTNCPFYLVISRRSRSPDYSITLNCGQHNHEPITERLGSAALRRMSQEKFGMDQVYKLVESRSQTGSSTAKEIAAELSLEFPELLLSPDDIWLIQGRLRKAGGSTVMTRRDAGPNPVLGNKKTPTLSDLQAEIQQLRGLVGTLVKAQQAAVASQVQMHQQHKQQLELQQQQLQQQQIQHQFQRQQHKQQQAAAAAAAAPPPMPLYWVNHP